MHVAEATQLAVQLLREIPRFQRDIVSRAPDRYARIRDGEFSIDYCRNILTFEKRNGNLAQLTELVYPAGNGTMRTATEFEANPLVLLCGAEYDDLVKAFEKF